MITLKDKYKNTRDFLFSFVNKEFLVFLFFLALSTGFWCVLTLNETYEEEIPIAISLTSTPDNVVITDPLPDTVKLVLRDKGYILLAYKHGDLLRPVRLQFPNHVKNEEHGAVTTAELQKLILPMLYASTKIVSIKAEKLDFTFNYGMSKRVPILFDGQIKTADTYYLSRTQINPDSATIYAPAHILAKISEVYTERIVEEDVADTLTRQAVIKKIPGAKIVPGKVYIAFFADVLTEKIINVPITAINMPEGLTLRTFPNVVPVKVVFGRSMYQAIRPELFKVVADYNEVAKHPSDRCSIMLKVVPKGIVNATLETQQVDYLIENM